MKFSLPVLLLLNVYSCDAKFRSRFGFNSNVKPTESSPSEAGTFIPRANNDQQGGEDMPMSASFSNVLPDPWWEVEVPPKLTIPPSPKTQPPSPIVTGPIGWWGKWDFGIPDRLTMPPSPHTRPPTFPPIGFTRPPSLDIPNDLTLPPSPRLYEFQPPIMDGFIQPGNVYEINPGNVYEPPTYPTFDGLMHEALVNPTDNAPRPETAECLSDEDCLFRAHQTTCPLFCIDGKCAPHEKPTPPVLRIRTGRKAKFGRFTLREDEELEKVFENPPRFYEKDDALKGKFFELTDGSEDILEVRYAETFFDIAARILENPKMKETVDGDKEMTQANTVDGTEIPETTQAQPNFTPPLASITRKTRRGLAIQDDAPDRWRVVNTASNPWRRNGRLSMGCTAALIGNRVLVTAAHCVWDRETDSWASFPIYFAAGQNGDEKPFGDSRVWKMTIPRGYQTCSTNSECRAHDWAVLVLYESDKLNVGYFGFSTSIGNSRLNLAGYPQSKNRQLWYDHCPLHADEGDWIKHRCDTEPGNSGSGIYKIVNGGRYVVAVHGGGYTNLWNRGADVDGDTSSAGRLYDRMLAYRVEYG